jgi:hypothetical protein
MAGKPKYQIQYLTNGEWVPLAHFVGQTFKSELYNYHESKRDEAIDKAASFQNCRVIEIETGEQIWPVV